ncbi:hypothetical protein DUI87_03173 [Hirundo rustica rustica]|uniref:Peptidase A2 domain-containing protein n=1 Tax=Hirundo rustica rustica TaxID=333673 RepID=A0A3M0L2U9_HIRRU|nr:hypothetical protein DUI87_03173 [Hirundo rustica rustica]
MCARRGAIGLDSGGRCHGAAGGLQPAEDAAGLAPAAGPALPPLPTASATAVAGAEVFKFSVNGDTAGMRPVFDKSNYTRADGQAGYEPLVQEQCQQTGMAALVQTLQLATPQQSFATIIQGVDEPFLCFAGRLMAAVEKQFGKHKVERESETRADTNVSASAPTNGDLLSRLAASTRRSAGVDVCTAKSVVIDSDKIHKVPLDAFGPLGDGMSAFLMGRSSATIQGIMVHLGLIDADFSGQIHAMVSTPTPPLTIPKGTRIAQLVPFKSSVSRTEDRSRGDSGFGSTGPPQVRWTAVLTKDHPETLCTVSMVGATPSEIHLCGLLDTGANVSILSLAAWPRSGL